MTTSSARCHSTGTTTWKDSLSIAGNTGTNPIGTTLWFNAMIRTKQEHYNFRDMKDTASMVVVLIKTCFVLFQSLTMLK
ncbi:hypothetical protein [Lysinibacillus tabacifolii]|uniref:Uncharacterized protein n=1 Tax=Lysinibacillus tabacifolii TaxID=1173107 RepID=A0ABY2SUW2_9BACI|nr:hypothetical protein [Lysinibacillus tabacifolii]TKI46647.1 hypothetical protein FC748_17305 [Lysinibacillus tabacifolii]